MKMSQFVSITLVIILGMFLNSCGQMTAEDEGMSSKSIEESSGTSDDTTTDDTTDTGTTTTSLFCSDPGAECQPHLNQQFETSQGLFTVIVKSGV